MKTAKPKSKPAAPTAEAELVRLALDAIVPSHKNPRKTFDPDALAQLAESIKTHDVLEPILVRPRKGREHIHGIAPANDAEQRYGVWPADGDPKGPEAREVVGRKAAKELAEALSKDHYELVAGERRWRASKLAGKETIPALVRDMTDREAAEARVIENDQREDVPPLEQAEGYRELIDLGDDVESIAAKIGRPPKYVAGRLTLTQLAPSLQEDLRAGKLPFGHALLLARLPAAEQEALVKSIPLYDEYGPDDSRVVALDDLRHEIRHTTRDLSAAPWKWDDETLVPAAGSCTKCPKRSGANPTLFDELLNGDGKQKTESCTDRTCYAAKQSAFVDLQIKKVNEKTGAEPLKVSREYRASKGVLPSDRYEVVTAKDAKAGKKGVQAAVEVETGKIVHVRVKKTPPQTGWKANQAKQQAKWAKENERRKQIEEIGKEAQAAALAIVGEKAAAAWADIAESPAAVLTLLRELARVLARHARRCDPIAARRELKLGKGWDAASTAIDNHIHNSDDAAECFAVLAELIAIDVCAWDNTYQHGDPRDRSFLDAFKLDKTRLMKAAEKVITTEQEQAAEQKCRVCGCTEDDCSQCVAKTGEACTWVEDDLCSACVETPAAKPAAKAAKKKRKAVKA